MSRIELGERTATHSHENLDIGPALCGAWVDTLVATATASGPEWTPD